MDYEFRRNSLDGTVWASFSMDHEAFGRWLTEELGQDQRLRQQLLEVIAELQQQRQHEFQQIGRDFTLTLDEEQALITANVLGYEHDDQEDDSLSIYDCESSAACGLEDFEQVLLAWGEFLAGR